jgi:hypothetical protein
MARSSLPTKSIRLFYLNWFGSEFAMKFFLKSCRHHRNKFSDRSDQHHKLPHHKLPHNEFNKEDNRDNSDLLLWG